MRAEGEIEGAGEEKGGKEMRGMRYTHNSALAEDKGSETVPEEFCVTGRGLCPGDQLWNVEGKLNLA